MPTNMKENGEMETLQERYEREARDFEAHMTTKAGHEFDDDGCCKHCGLDGAEWYWWLNSTYEGRAMQTPQPPCKESRRR